ncbi:hypothetical protein [Massilia aquatica]|uniref:HEAT repeat domain-containing protein n=1 Tax=Massilia aquatica TaxID=2609000 RepID=A0ABX0M3Y4_9BURK|nr:hypothetical protein [Massilia aquatica]NHZ39790.1 hypothetical protein [Massilia aquatica]
MHAFLLAAAGMSCYPQPPFSACMIQRAPIPLPDPLRDFVTRPATPGAPVHLPANAAGVLYCSPEHLEKQQFSIVETASGRALEVVLSPVRGAGNVDGLPSLQKFDSERASLYRVEARNGFEPGRRYTVRQRVSGQVLEVAIDREAVDLKRSLVRLRATQPAWRENMGSGCWGPPEQVLVQAVDYEVPAALAPYRQRLLAVTVKAAGLAWRVPEGQQVLRPFELAQPGFPSAYGLPAGLLHASVDALPALPLRASLAAAVAFLEVDSDWHPSAPSFVDIAPDRLAPFDSVSGLRAAMRSGDSARIAAQLAVTPVRTSDMRYGGPVIEPESLGPEGMGKPAALRGWLAQRHRGALEATIYRLMAHREPAVRSAALPALVRVQYLPLRDPTRARTAIDALLAAKRDPDAGVRRSAVLALFELRRAVDELELVCEFTETGVPISPAGCVPSEAFLPLLPSARAF